MQGKLIAQIFRLPAFEFGDSLALQTDLCSRASSGVCYLWLSFNLLVKDSSDPNQEPTKDEPAAKPGRSQENCLQAVELLAECDGKDSPCYSRKGGNRSPVPRMVG